MFMGHIHELEDAIIKVSALRNLIYKSHVVRMKFFMKFLVELDKRILILMLKTKKKKKERERAKKIVKRHNEGWVGGRLISYKDLL